MSKISTTTLQNMDYLDLIELEKQIAVIKKQKQEEQILYKSEFPFRFSKNVCDMIHLRFMDPKFKLVQYDDGCLSEAGSDMWSRLRQSMLTICDISLGNYTEYKTPKRGEDYTAIKLNGSIIKSDPKVYELMYEELNNLISGYIEEYNKEHGFDISNKEESK